MPEMPSSESAARTSSSLKGLMIAVISFIAGPRRVLYQVCSADAVFMPAIAGLSNSHLTAWRRLDPPTMHHSGAPQPRVAFVWCEDTSALLYHLARVSRGSIVGHYSHRRRQPRRSPRRRGFA